MQNYQSSLITSLCVCLCVWQLPQLEPHAPGISDEAYYLAAMLVKQFDQVEAQQQKQAVAGSTPPRPKGPQKKGSVLIFLPGQSHTHRQNTYQEPVLLSYSRVEGC